MYDVCVITSERHSGDCYLDGLVETYGPYPLIFVAGSQSVKNSYLDKYRYNPLYKIIEQDYLTCPNHVNMNMNYFRALLNYQNNVELITIEDDVIFTQNWFPKLQQARENIPAPSYLLTLYRPGKIESTQEIVEVDPRHFSCSQGLFFYNIPLVDLFTYIWKYGVDKHTEAIDLLMGRFLRQRGIPILAINPPIVQHVGEITNGISGHFHSSESFTP